MLCDPIPPSTHTCTHFSHKHSSELCCSLLLYQCEELFILKVQIASTQIPFKLSDWVCQSTRLSPRTITTDRSMNFVGELKEAWERHDNEVIFFHELFANGTNWIFSLSSSPNINRAAEQLVKSCKCTFYTILQCQCRCSSHSQH